LVWPCGNVTVTFPGIASHQPREGLVWPYGHFQVTLPGIASHQTRGDLVWPCGHAHMSSSSCSTPRCQDLREQEEDQAFR
jgi:hypothetical protein